MADIYEYLKVLTKLEIEYEDQGQVVQNLRSYIKSLEESRILIYPPNINGKAVSIQDGQKISLIVNTDKNVYTGDSIVLGKELSNTSGVWISYPLNSSVLQRREFLRSAIRLNTKITVFEDSTYDRRREVYTITNDISGKGLSFISDAPLSSYYDLECQVFMFEGDMNPVYSKCEHIYTKQLDDNKFLNALAFIDISNEDTDKIVQECFKYRLLRRV